MRQRRWQTLFLIAGVVLAWAVQAQSIYRCGNSYSQVPCPGAVPMDLSDPRQPEQKKQTEAAALNDARLANTMAQERLAEEQRLLADLQPKPQSAASAPAKARAKASGTRKTKRAKPKAKAAMAASAEMPAAEKRMLQKR